MTEMAETLRESQPRRWIPLPWAPPPRNSHTSQKLPHPLPNIHFCLRRRKFHKSDTMALAQKAAATRFAAKPAVAARPSLARRAVVVKASAEKVKTEADSRSSSERSRTHGTRGAERRGRIGGLENAITGMVVQQAEQAARSTNKNSSLSSSPPPLLLPRTPIGSLPHRPRWRPSLPALPSWPWPCLRPPRPPRRPS